MTILFNEVFRTMAVIPETMPWRLFIDMDEGDSKREAEDFGLELILEYGTTRHHLLDSDSIRDGEFYDTVELEDVEECFDSIIFEACSDVTNPEYKYLSLYHIIADVTAKYKEDWRHRYKLRKKESHIEKCGSGGIVDEASMQ